MISDPYAIITRFRLYELLDLYPVIISDKGKLAPSEPKTEPEYTVAGWHRGYSFKHFWNNCYAILGEIGKIDGMQQLCHHYYLRNGSLGASMTVMRIKKFLGVAINNSNNGSSNG